MRVLGVWCTDGVAELRWKWASSKASSAREFADCRFVITGVTVAGGWFASGHLGGLTRIVGFDVVDIALTETGKFWGPSV
ncbi:hypothetical protein P3H15_37260 [Rhodococcus sp. T2V]|nr:hypothetical protein [Rhodococcus sp. T2V]